MPRRGVSPFVFALLVTSCLARAQVPATQPQRPFFGVLISPGVAPCAIHVNGLRFLLSVGTPLTAQYDWDFGDPQGRFNKLAGFNAAHVYDHPGKYLITLTVTDETNHTQSANATIVISPDTRRRFYLSPEGSDINAGNMQQIPFKSVARAFKAMTDNSELLLKAGSHFDISTSLQLHHHNILISRYDDGADPVLIRSKGNGSSIFSMDKHCDGITIEHISFDSPYAADPNGQAPKIGVSAIHAAGRNITVRNCTFLNLDDAVNANGNPQGLLVQDCTSPLVTGLRGYFLWGAGSDLVCLGNSSANSTREHNLRVSGAERMLIAENNFANLDRRPADKFDESKGCIELHKSSYGYVAHNTVADGTIRVGPLGINEDPSTSTDWVIIDGNTLQDTRISANAGSHHILIRNNIVRNQHDQAIVINAPDPQGRTFSDFTIINNTDINNSNTGSFIKLWGHVNGIVLKNNLFVAPGLTPGISGASAVNVSEDDLSSFTEIERNIWPAPATFMGETSDGVCVVGRTKGVQYKNPAAWSRYPQVKEDRFINVTVDEHGRPASDSPAAGYALPTGLVRYDREGKARPISTPTAGAMEIGPLPISR